MPQLAYNKKVAFDYEVLEKFEAGLELQGWEVKSIKNKSVSLVGSQIIIRGNEAFAVGINISPYQASNLPKEIEQQRTIKLLLSKKEIKYLAGKIQQKGLTIVPLSLYTKGKNIKIEIVLVKGKKKFDKRETIKERESKVKIGRIMREK